MSFQSLYRDIISIVDFAEATAEFAILEENGKLAEHPKGGFFTGSPRAVIL
jgi:hypothetical protein